MALHVDFTMKSRVGYYRNGKRKIWLCSANALWAEMNFYAVTEDEKLVQKVQLCGFIADTEHLKRCIKAGIIHYQGLTIFASKMNADMWKAVKMLTKNGIKVTIK